MKTRLSKGWYNMGKMYKTRSKKFKLSYKIIDELNEYITNYEIERDTFLKHGEVNEANWRQEIINSMEKDLENFKVDGFITERWL
jgi:hypothetical protein